MTDLIGVLGETTATAIGVQTAYTTPAAKAAKGRIMAQGQAASGGATVVTIRVNGMIVSSKSISAGNYFWTGSDKMINSGAALPDGSGADQIASPCAKDYYLSAADTVTVEFATNAAQSSRVCFVGTEVDNA